MLPIQARTPPFAIVHGVAGDLAATATNTLAFTTNALMAIAGVAAMNISVVAATTQAASPTTTTKESAAATASAFISIARRLLLVFVNLPLLVNGFSFYIYSR